MSLGIIQRVATRLQAPSEACIDFVLPIDGGVVVIGWALSPGNELRVGFQQQRGPALKEVGVRRYPRPDVAQHFGRRANETDYGFVARASFGAPMPDTAVLDIDLTAHGFSTRLQATLSRPLSETARRQLVELWPFVAAHALPLVGKDMPTELLLQLAKEAKDVPTRARVHVDHAFAVPGLGVLLYGWSIDPASELQGVRAVSPSGAGLGDLLESWERVPRPDVSDAFRDLKLPGDEHGFLVLLRDATITAAHVGAEAKLLMQLANGATVLIGAAVEEVARATQIAELFTRTSTPHDARWRRIMEQHIEPATAQLRSTTPARQAAPKRHALELGGSGFVASAASLPRSREPVVLGTVGGRIMVAAPADLGSDVLPLQVEVGRRLALVVDEAALQPRSYAFNILYNSDLSKPELPWIFAQGGPKGKLGVDLSEQWTLRGGHVAYLTGPQGRNVPLSLRYCDADRDTRLIVAPRTRYVLNGHLAVHRCTAEVTVDFFDIDGGLIDQKVVIVSPDKMGGPELSGYFTLNKELYSPADCAYAELTLTKSATLSGTDSYLFFAGVALQVAAHGAMPLNTSQMPAEQIRAYRRSLSGPTNVFELQLPADTLGGGATELSVFYGVERRLCAGSPLQLASSAGLIAFIESVHGVSVKLTVSAAIRALPDPTLFLRVDDELAASLQPAEGPAGGDIAVHFAIPSRMLDGRPHVLSVSTADGRTLAQHPVILPYIQNSWRDLELYSARPLPSALAPAAAHRYVALQSALARLSDACNAGADGMAIDQAAGLMNRVHELLVEGSSGKVPDFVLAFPRVDRPKVSIVIPVHNQWTVTRHCLASLLLAGNRASFEVIVVDDGSSDRTLELGKWTSQVTCVRNDTAQGFVRACNRGAEHARGEYVVFLNNDTEVTAGWLDELLGAFATFEQVGMAGCKLLYPDGRLQDAGGIVWNSGDPWNYGRNANAHDPRYCYARQADYLSGAAIMLATALWEKVGGFSSEFEPAYFEDTDLAFKVRAAGYKTVYVPTSQVYHFEGISSGTSTSSGMKRFQEVNRPKFKQKWLADCAANGEVGKNVDLAKDRGVKLRALFIDAGVPRPNNDAGSYAAIQEMRLVQSLGFKVTFIAENLAYLGRDTERLQRMGVEAIHAPFATSVHEFLERRGAEFDLIYITRYAIAQKFLPACRQAAPSARILFCNADLHFLRQMREALLTEDEQLLAAARETRDQELAVCRDVDVVLSYNDAEHAVLEASGIPRRKIARCPWVVETAASVPSFQDRYDIAYLGGFGHGPNRQAVMFFVDEVLPRVREVLPEVNFRVYGSGSAKALADLERDGIVIEGHVENVADVYDRCRIFVAPLLTGAGLKGKVVSALAHGTPSIISSIAAEGSAIRDGQEAFIADDPKTWATRIVDLYRDEALWNTMSRAALDLAARRYNFEEGRALMAQALERAGLAVDPAAATSLYVNTAEPR